MMDFMSGSIDMQADTLVIFHFYDSYLVNLELLIFLVYFFVA